MTNSRKLLIVAPLSRAECKRRLKETADTQNIPVIVLTGNKDDAVRRTMLGLGADAFLYKPPEMERLLAELGRYIEVPSETMM